MRWCGAAVGPARGAIAGSYVSWGAVKIACARDARLRRRLAAVALRQGDDRRRARRLVGGDRLARLAAGLAGVVARPRAARRRSRPARGRGDPLGSLPAHAAEPRVDRAEGDRRDRERAPRHQGQSARRLGRRALRRPDARDDPALLVALRHDAGAGMGGDGDAEARLVRRRHRARARGRRARLPRLQDQHRRPRRRAAGAHARLRPRRRASTATRRRSCSRRSTRLLEAFREGTGGRAQPIVDLNFNLTTEGIVRVARALEPFDLAWLEVDSYDPAALAHVRAVRRSRSARARTSTRSAASARTSKRARWTSPRST